MFAPRIIRLLALAILPLIATPALADDRSDKVDELFARWDSTVTPGCAVGIVRDGNVLYERGYGMADLEHGVPISPDSAFYICSTSKQFTAFSIALLATRGAISLDDSLQKYFPDFPEYGKTITVNHLVHHSSGIRDIFTMQGLRGEFPGAAIMKPDDIMKLLKRQEATNFMPGTDYLYSNSGYFLMSQIVEKATGQTLREFAAKELFGPLGMTLSVFCDDLGMIIPNRAFGYSRRGAGYALDMPYLEFVGDGGLYTSVRDLYRWDRMFYDAPFGQAAIDLALTRGKLQNGTTYDYAFGLGHQEYRGLHVVAHAGGINGYRAELMRFPDQKFSVVILANTSEADPTALAYRIADIYLAGEFAAPPKAAPKGGADGNLKRREGRYFHEGSGSLWEAFVKDGVINLRRGGWTFPLVSQGGGRFVPQENIPIREVEFKKDGATRRLEMTREGGVTDVATEAELVKPTPEALQACAGVYFSDELDVAATVSVDQDQLRIQTGRGRSAAIRPTVEDWFLHPAFSVHFIQDAAQGVSSLEVFSNRSSGMMFVRQ